MLTVFDRNVLNICGNVKPHLEAHAEHLRVLEGVSTINVGPQVDIAWLQRLLEGRIGVAGNIDHVNLLPLGTPTEIESAVHAAIDASGGDPRFIVAPGCEITSETPVEKVKAFVSAASSYAHASAR